MEKEEWREINGYEGYYQVSNHGRVRSVNRIINGRWGKQKRSGKILKQSINHSGYLCILLYKNNKGKQYRTHQLVAMAFLGHTPCGHDIVVDHKDNDKFNNHVDNLQLTTSRHNTSKDRKGYSSNYIGVTWDINRNNWSSQIQIGDKLIYLGRFINEEDAANMYQKALNNIHLYKNPKQFRELLREL